MFRGALIFNQPLDGWDVSSVKDMFVRRYQRRRMRTGTAARVVLLSGGCRKGVR